MIYKKWNVTHSRIVNPFYSFTHFCCFYSILFPLYVMLYFVWCYFFFSGNPLNVPINKFNILYTFFCRLLSLHFNPHFMFVACKQKTAKIVFLFIHSCLDPFYFFSSQFKIFHTLYSHFVALPPKKTIRYFYISQYYSSQHVKDASE